MDERKLRFKVDENLPLDVADLLRGQGHEAHTVQEEGLTGAPDLALAATCRSEGRALLTLDTGFGDLRRYPPDEHHGIIVLRLRDTSRPAVLGVLQRLLSHLEGSSALRGALWIVSEDDVRIRRAAPPTGGQQGT